MTTIHCGRLKHDKPDVVVDPRSIVICDAEDFPKFADEIDPCTNDAKGHEFTCDRCGHHEPKDTAIHNGQSVRRDCAFCNRTAGFPVWYGQADPQESTTGPGQSTEDALTAPEPPANEHQCPRAVSMAMVY